MIPATFQYPPSRAIQSVQSKQEVRLQPINGQSFTASDTQSIDIIFQIDPGTGWWMLKDGYLLFNVTNNSGANITYNGSQLIRRIRISTPSGGTIEDVQDWNHVMALMLQSAPPDFLNYAGNISMNTAALSSTMTGQGTGTTWQHAVPLIMALWRNKAFPAALMAEPLTITITLEGPTVAVRRAAAGANSYTLTNMQIVCDVVQFTPDFENSIRQQVTGTGGIVINDNTYLVYRSPVANGLTSLQQVIPVNARVNDMVHKWSFPADQVAEGESINKANGSTLSSFWYNWGSTPIPSQPVVVNPAAATRQIADIFRHFRQTWDALDSLLNPGSYNLVNYFPAAGDINDARSYWGYNFAPFPAEGPWDGNQLDTRGTTQTLVLYATMSAGIPAGTLFSLVDCRITFTLAGGRLTSRF